MSHDMIRTAEDASKECQRIAGLLNGHASARLDRAIEAASKPNRKGPKYGPARICLVFTEGMLIGIAGEQNQVDLATRLVNLPDCHIQGLLAGLEAGMCLRSKSSPTLEGAAPATARSLPLSGWRSKFVNLRNILALVKETDHAHPDVERSGLAGGVRSL